MADRTVARRYSEAFVNTLEASDRLEEGLAELKAVTQTYAESKPLQRFIGSPEIGPEDKERLLNRLWAEAAGKETMAFLRLLLKRDRVEQLPAIVEEAVSVIETRQGILRGRVTTAHPISAAEMDQLAKGVGKALGKRVVLERSVDPKILGGVRVAVGTTLLDGSVQAMLEGVRRQLKEVKVN